MNKQELLSVPRILSLLQASGQPDHNMPRKRAQASPLHLEINFSSFCRCYRPAFPHHTELIFALSDRRQQRDRPCLIRSTPSFACNFKTGIYYYQHNTYNHCFVAEAAKWEAGTQYMIILESTSASLAPSLSNLFWNDCLLFFETTHLHQSLGNTSSTTKEQES